MPSLLDIQKQHDPLALVKKSVSDLSDYTHRNTICYYSNWLFSPDESDCGINDQDTIGFMEMCDGLDFKKGADLILHTPGGDVGATEAIINHLNGVFNGDIRAIVPQNAMSAATMLACACDEIIMGKQSAIGPIDPQMTLVRSNGIANSLPAHSILADFEKAKSEIAADANAARVWVPKLLEIPNGFLDLCSKTIQLSKSKVAEWLNAYMFKDNIEKPGVEIANWLGDFNEHKTHGRPINYQLAQEKGLKIKLLKQFQKTVTL